MKNYFTFATSNKQQATSNKQQATKKLWKTNLMSLS
jgi:ribosomal protein L28